MIFQVIGLLIASGFCAWIGLIGLIQMFFNDIGGAGSTDQTLAGLLIAALGFGAAYWLWAQYSPFTITVSP